MTSAFSGMQGKMYSAGAMAMAGLKNGINTSGASAIEAARNVANNVAKSVNSALKIHSPSRVLDQSGQYAGQGLAGGIKKSESLVQKAASKSLALPVRQAGTKAISVPKFESRTTVIKDTVNTFSGNNNNSKKASGSSESVQFVFSPTYHFEGGNTGKNDVVEANRMSQAEFKRMMKQYLHSEGRQAFA